MKRIIVSAWFLVSLALPALEPVFAAEAAGPQGSVKVEQVTASELGTWTLLFEDGSTLSSTDPGVNKMSYTFGLTDFGQTTLQTTVPAGMSVKIGVYRGGDLVETVTVPQYNFRLYPNDNYRFVIQYALSRLGTLGITSLPSGVRFRMRGPTRRTYNAVTPHTFHNLPAGRYTVSMGSTATCVRPAPKTATVEPEKRSVLQITLGCDQKEEAAVDTSRPTKRSLTEYAEKREFNRRGERK